MESVINLISKSLGLDISNVDCISCSGISDNAIACVMLSVRSTCEAFVKAMHVMLPSAMTSSVLDSFEREKQSSEESPPWK